MVPVRIWRRVTGALRLCELSAPRAACQPAPRPYDRFVPTLWLLRHAKSSWSDPKLPDRDRPLAPRGREAAYRLARYAASAGVRPRLVLCSPARRARETLDAMLAGLGAAVVLYEESLYRAGADELLARLREVPAGVESLLLVGHNPGLADLLARLGGAEARRTVGAKLPTGALARLELDGPWRELERAALAAYVVPRELP
jgi:phosphohistidine phosphatase